MEEESIAKKVLIVDDSGTGRMLLREVILGAHAGYAVTLAESGTDALGKVVENSPDIILLDVMMPDMDGFEVCRRLKADKKTAAIPVLFITAMESVQGMIEGLQAGGADYITKPFIAEEVRARVAAHLRIKKAEEERVRMANLETIKNMVVTYNHNMNQPLMAAVTYLELLLAKTGEDDDRHRHLLKAKTEIGKIAAILKKIQELEKFKSVGYVGDVKMFELDE